jgi:hypothetical protein
MGTISDKLMRIINTKEDIRQALISKGYDVPTSIPFKEYAKMISDLPCRVDSFPDIEGIVARYSALGLTNEQMKENPVWVDKTGNGHDLQLKNFFWGEMSGVGGYKLNWGDSNVWKNYITQGTFGTGEVTDNTIHITSAKTNNALFETGASLKSVEYKVLIKGLTDDIYLRYGVFNDGKELWTEIKNDGIYTLPSYDYDSRYNMKWKVMSQTYPIDCNITIEQLPLYPGALVFDGVDDYGVCDNFPILTKEKGYTVVALRQWIEEKNSVTALASNSKNWNQDGAFVFEYNNLENNYPNIEISFGSNNIFDRGLSPYSYQTSKSYNGNLIESGSFLGSDKLVVAKANENLSPNSNVAIWELVILDHDATEEELTKIKDYFVKTYPWLFPDQAWTVTGKTNEDEDRATIANITGNGNDLILSNFGFAGGSGYGLYAVNFLDSIWVKNTGFTKISPSSFTIENTIESTQATVYINTSGKDVILPSFKVNITGLGNVVWKYHYIDDAGDRQSIILQDGVNVLPTSYVSLSATSTWVGFGTITGVTDNITIEQIPEYEGYLVTDGVDDKIISSVFKMGKDFTVVGEWVLLQNINTSSLRKDGSFVIRNHDEGLSMTINRTSPYIRVLDKSLKAFCSNGAIYKSDWTEQIDTTPQSSTGGSSQLMIAGYERTMEHDKIAFKNLAIYPTVPSKDDCIKAYNYLQTLKAK